MAAMAWQTTGNVTEFLAAAGPWLRRERARNTVIVSVTETMRVNEAAAGKSSRAAAGQPQSPAPGQPAGQALRPLFGWWSDPAGAVAGAFMHTPPFPVLLTEVPLEAAAELSAVTMAGRPLGGVNAYREVAAAFADGWRHGNQAGRVVVYRRQRLYRLGGRVLAGPAAGGGGGGAPAAPA